MNDLVRICVLARAGKEPHFSASDLFCNPHIRHLTAGRPSRGARGGTQDALSF
jgi:hypothetical protein